MWTFFVFFFELEIPFQTEENPTHLCTLKLLSEFRSDSETELNCPVETPSINTQLGLPNFEDLGQTLAAGYVGLNWMLKGNWGSKVNKIGLGKL